MQRTISSQNLANFNPPNASVHEIIKEEAKKGAKPDLQCSQRGELLKGARLYPPDLVMLQASVEKHTQTYGTYKMCNPEI